MSYIMSYLQILQSDAFLLIKLGFSDVPFVELPGTLQASSNEVTRARGRATKDVGCEHLRAFANHIQSPITLDISNHFDLALTILKLSSQFFTILHIFLCQKLGASGGKWTRWNSATQDGQVGWVLRDSQQCPATVEFVPGSLAQGPKGPNMAKQLEHLNRSTEDHRGHLSKVWHSS